jgi:hypothetical protein
LIDDGRTHSDRQKLGPIARTLSPNQDGDVLNAALAFARVLKSAGVDFHTLADHIEKQNGNGLSEAEMRKLYDAGFKEAGKPRRTRSRSPPGTTLGRLSSSSRSFVSSTATG